MEDFTRISIDSSLSSKEVQEAVDKIGEIAGRKITLVQESSESAIFQMHITDKLSQDEVSSLINHTVTKEDSVSEEVLKKIAVVKPKLFNQAVLDSSDSMIENRQMFVKVIDLDQRIQQSIRLPKLEEIEKSSSEAKPKKSLKNRLKRLKQGVENSIIKRLSTERRQKILTKAVEKKDAERIRRLSKESIDFSDSDDEGYTALDLAIKDLDTTEDESSEVIDALLEKGVSLKDSADGGQVALLKAIYKGNLNKVRILVKAGVDINTQHLAGFRPIDIAARQGDINTVRFLLDKGATIEKNEKEDQRSAIHIAAEYGQIEVFDLLRQHTDIKQQDSDGKTIMHIAIEHGQLDFIKHVQESREITAEDKSFLMTTTTNKSRGLLHHAVKHGKPAILDYLAETLSLKKKDKYGFTPLDLAISKGKKELLSALIRFGARPAMITSKLSTLDMAVQKGDSEDLKILLSTEEGRSIFAENSSSIVLRALKKGRVEALITLLELGLDPNFMLEGRDETLLYGAIRIGSKALVKALLDKGADTTTPYLGTTPAALASRLKQHEIASMLQ